MPTLIGLPLCAAAPVSVSNPATNAAAKVRSAFPHGFGIVSSLSAGRRCARPYDDMLFAHFFGRHDTPVIRRVRVLLPHLRLLRPVAMPGPRLEIAKRLVHLVELGEQLGDQAVRRAVIGEQVVADAVPAPAPHELIAAAAYAIPGTQ